MAKPGIELENTQPLIRSILETTGWALCIGAGTSLPIFPSWSQLVENLISKDVGVGESDLLFKSLGVSFQADALLQAAKDRLGLGSEAFANLLSTELYKTVRSLLPNDDWNKFSSTITSHSGWGVTKDWLDYIQVVEKNLPHCSAMSLAKIIVNVLDSNLAPSAILSFNAEPFLPSLINGLWRRKLAETYGIVESHNRRRKIIDLVTNSISMRRNSRLPYYFIHGLLPVPDNPYSKVLTKSSHGLVFSESDYLQLSNSVFSWQAATFSDVCSSRSVVFIGVSLTDSNMRRWLSWVHTNRIQEVYATRGKLVESTIHYWITVMPASATERRWMESIVAHLGVRIIWIARWDQVGTALERLLGL